MSRKNIYEIIESQKVSAIDLWGQISCLLKQEMRDYNYQVSLYSWFSKVFLNHNDFSDLRIKYNRSFENFFETTTYSNKITNAFDTIYGFSELLLLFLPETFKYITTEEEYFYIFYGENQELDQPLYEIIQIIKYALDFSNHEIIESEDGKKIVIEKNAKISQTVQIASETNISFSIKLLEYNHYSNGIEEKRNILKHLTNFVEPLIKDKNLTQQLKTDYGRLVNDLLDIRHSQDVSRFTEKELEKWYDDTYNTILAIIIDLEQKEISKKIKDLQNE